MDLNNQVGNVNSVSLGLFPMNLTGLFIDDGLEVPDLGIQELKGLSTNLGGVEVVVLDATRAVDLIVLVLVRDVLLSGEIEDLNSVGVVSVDEDPRVSS